MFAKQKQSFLIFIIHNLSSNLYQIAEIQKRIFSQNFN